VRDLYWSFLRIFLILIACVSFPIQVSAATLDTIQVVDETGLSQTLSEPRFNYSYLHENYMSEHLQVVISPTKVAWVHFSQIKTAEFERIGMTPLNISITVQSGEVLKGRFPDDKLEIKGKRGSEEVVINVKSVRMIQIGQFSEGWGAGKKILKPEEASSKWQQERKKLRVWAVIDGNEKVSGYSLAIQDSYDTNRSGSLIGVNARNKKLLNDKITLVGERILFDMALNEIRELEFTGKKIQGKPAVFVSKADGSVGMFVILMRTKVSYLFFDEGVNIEYGDFDGDDFIIYHAPYGWEGISLLPLRRIILKQQ